MISYTKLLENSQKLSIALTATHL